MPSTRATLTSDAVLYLPGIMGSELVDARDTVVWGMSPGLLARQLIFRDVMSRLVPRPDDGIRARRPVQLPVPVPLLCGIEPYRRLEHRLQQVTLRPEAVRPFAFDWRRSIAEAAVALAPVARAHLAQWRRRFAALPQDERRGRPEPRLTLVGHSMGGLVASWFATALRDQGGDDVRLVITLGTPFAGSVSAVRVLADGDYLPFGLFGSALRDATRTMPGVYELLATYRCVDEGDDEDGLARPFRRLTPADLAGLGADPALTEAAQQTVADLRTAMTDEAGGRVHSLVGTYQPTLQSVRFAAGGKAEFAEVIADSQTRRREDHRGDGTVFRYAALPDGVTPSLLPQSHGALQKASEGIDFAAAVATGRDLGAFQAVSELGVRVPDLVPASEPVRVEVLDAEQAVCQVHDVESNRLVTVATLVRDGDRLAVDIPLRDPGTYRVGVAAGGYSPVERLVIVASAS